MPTSDDMLRAIFESSLLGIAVVDSNMRFRRANPALLQMLGYTEAELLGLSADDLIHPDGVHNDSAPFQETRSGQRDGYAIDKRYSRKDGALRWARVKVSIHRTADAPLIVGMVEDITEAKVATETQHELMHHLEERVKQLTALQRAARLMQEAGIAWSERLRTVANLLPPAMQYPEITTGCVRYGDEVYTTPGHALTPWVLRADFQTKDGQQGAIEVAYHQARRDEVTGPFLAEEVALLGSLAEMVRAESDRYHGEIEVREANARLNLALNTAGMGVWEWDVTRDEVRWSEQLSEMTGVHERLRPFASNAEIVHPEDRERVLRRIRNAAEGTDDLSALEFRFRRPGGGWRHMMGRGRILREPPARASYILAALVDVSERRAMEESLRQAQKVESLGQVASGVAHDFNNLLTVLLGGSQILREEIPSGHPLRQVVDDLYAASERGVALTRQLLMFSRKASFQPAAVDVCDVITRLEPILKRVAQEAVEVRLRLDRTAGRVWADPAQIEQVVMNLVVNARDAMPSGGVVIITASGTSDLAADGATTVVRYTVIEVSDTGTGIDPALQSRIFEPFFTTKEEGKGTGLGLATVMGVARQWGGQVSLRSTLGEGTTFSVRFPQHGG